jgi:AraC family transcriptional regulator
VTLSPNHFYGTSLRLAEAGGFTLLETVYSSELRTPEHSHELAYLGVVLEGRSNQTAARTIRNCHPGTLTYHPPGETHSDHFFGPRVRLLQIEINPRRLEEIAGGFTSLILRPIHRSNIQQTWLVSRLQNELRQRDELSHLVVEGLTLELMAEVWRGFLRSSSSRRPEWLKMADALIHDRFAEQFSLSEVAMEVGVHSSHLAREFRRFYRKTMGEKVRELRVEFACGELHRSDKPLAEIAAQAGFCDQSHFSRVFRNSVGTTPDQFRRNSQHCKSGSIRA